MRYRTLGTSGIEVSRIGFGTWALGGGHWGEADDRQSIAAIHAAIDAGVNLIDTAPAYGKGRAEEVVGKAIRGRRDRVVIATKCGLHAAGETFLHVLRPGEIRKELEASLGRLGVEAIDLYQCHWPDPDTPIEDTMAEMAAMRDEGKIRAIGVSNFDKALLARALAAAPVVSLQPPYSILQRGIEADLLPFCRDRSVGVISYGTLGGGILTGKYAEPPSFPGSDCRSFFYPFYREPHWSRAAGILAAMRGIAGRRGRPVAHVAINWVRQQPGITAALVGARTPAQAVLNAGALGCDLAPEELAAISAACDRAFTE